MVPAHKHVATQNTKCTKNFHKVHLKPGALLEPGVHGGVFQSGKNNESWACQWARQRQCKGRSVTLQHHGKWDVSRVAWAGQRQYTLKETVQTDVELGTLHHFSAGLRTWTRSVDTGLEKDLGSFRSSPGIPGGICKTDGLIVAQYREAPRGL